MSSFSRRILSPDHCPTDEERDGHDQCRGQKDRDVPPPQVFGARSGITEEAAQVEEQGNQSNDGCDEATASIFPPKP
jgi:hypothetical protein